MMLVLLGFAVVHGMAAILILRASPARGDAPSAIDLRAD